MAPQDGAGGGFPTPSKLSADSDSTAYESDSAAWTITGETTFGTMWRRTILGCPAPTSTAESTYGWCLAASTAPRMTRAKCGDWTMAMATITVCMLGFMNTASA